MTKAEKTKQFIIEQSAPVFNTKGIAATAMSNIMEVTDLAKGSLYVHFQNKEELSFSVVDYNLSLLVEKVTTAVAKQDSAKDKLFAYLDVFVDPLNPPVAGGCPMLNFGMEADDNYPVIRKKVYRVVEAAQETIEGIISQGIAAKEFKSDWNANEFATKMFAMIEGGILICRTAGNNDKMKVINRLLKKEIEAQLA